MYFFVVSYIECQKNFTSTLRKVANLSSIKILILEYECINANKKNIMWARHVSILWVVSRSSIFNFRFNYKRFLFIKVIRIHVFYKNQFNSKFVAKSSNFTLNRMYISRRSFQKHTCNFFKFVSSCSLRLRQNYLFFIKN